MTLTFVSAEQEQDPDKEQRRQFRIEQARQLRGEDQNAEPSEQVKSQSTPRVVNKVGSCVDCNGSGFFDGIFGRRECTPCYGTGLDCSNLLDVVRYQAKRIKNAKSEYTRLKKEHEQLIDRYGRQRLKDEDERNAVRDYGRAKYD